MRESVYQGKNLNRKCEEENCANENASGTNIPELIPELRPKILPKIMPRRFIDEKSMVNVEIENPEYPD